MNKFDQDVFDAELWYHYALENYDEKHLILYGRGLGATFACYVSSNNNPKRLCLESPFYSFSYLGRYHFPFLPHKLISKYFVDVKCKIYILQGKLNNLIHYKNS